MRVLPKERRDSREYWKHATTTTTTDDWISIIRHCLRVLVIYQTGTSVALFESAGYLSDWHFSSKFWDTIGDFFAELWSPRLFAHTAPEPRCVALSLSLPATPSVQTMIMMFVLCCIICLLMLTALWA